MVFASVSPESMASCDSRIASIFDSKRVLCGVTKRTGIRMMFVLDQQQII